MTNAHMPASFSCPAGSENYKYDLDGTVDADNQSNSAVTIKSMSSSSTVTAKHGNWKGAVGDKSGADNLKFSPGSVPAGARTTIKFISPWNCSNSVSGVSTYADFAVVLSVVTSAGTFKLNLKHRLAMA